LHHASFERKEWKGWQFGQSGPDYKPAAGANPATATSTTRKHPETSSITITNAKHDANAPQASDALGGDGECASSRLLCPLCFCRTVQPNN
jgi:hypothetical protein